MCEIACSLHQDGVVNPAAARVAIVGWAEEGLHVPAVCLQCDVAGCERVCQPGAIGRNAATGALIVNYDLCIGCRMCVVGCPYGAMTVQPVGGRVIKCNLCEGEPRCVCFCETGALRFVEPAEVCLSKRVTTARALVGGE